MFPKQAALSSSTAKVKILRAHPNWFSGEIDFCCVTAAGNPDVSLLRDHQMNFVFSHYRVHPLPCLEGHARSPEGEGRHLQSFGFGGCPLEASPG